VDKGVTRIKHPPQGNPRAAPNSGNTSCERITIHNAMLDICRSLSLHPKETMGPYEMCRVPSQKCKMTSPYQEEY